MSSKRIVPLPSNERERMSSLRRLEILDTAPERAYDDIVELASAICGTPIAVMTLIDGDRQWMKAKIGLPMDETPREESFCTYAILDNEMLVVPDAQADDRFADMFAVQSGLKFYAGSPIRSPDGFNLGTLCVLDVQTRSLTQAQTSALEALRRMIESHLELRRANLELVRLEQQKRELTELVVHDLKNPITSILPNAAYIERSKGISDNARSAAKDILGSTQAMLGLVMNLLDISRAEDATLTPQRSLVDVPQLIEEVRASLGARAVDRGSALALAISDEVAQAQLDRDLTRRILENLADNALKYARGGRVTLGARWEGRDLLLTVEDDGPGIPASERERIFEKYARIDGSPQPERSRGLGLTFCRLASEAHGGQIWVEEVTPRGSRFCVRLPRE